ncbi:MAG TPA: non-heme iron oxygenase ferredoxin subunit [bacterium]|nr:non-heme iron oxygenase ferredoxin subunit [bacterium]
MTTTAAFVRVASVDELPAGMGKAVTVDGQRIALFNVNGTFYAIDDTCTHEEASLAAGAVYGEIVACPKHGSRFHLPTGRVLSLPAVVPVSTYQVKVEDGQVLLLPVPRRGRGMPHKL